MALSDELVAALRETVSDQDRKGYLVKVGPRIVDSADHEREIVELYSDQVPLVIGIGPSRPAITRNRQTTLVT
jgi:hypothetical protein